jgi:hypothetical protein
MIEDLKVQVEKTFGRKVDSRGAAELLSEDIYLKTNYLISYNTLRRLFGLAEYRKPRESTLNYLARYCSFEDFQEFCKQYPKIDIWPRWEGFFLTMDNVQIDVLILQLKIKKQEHLDFPIAFSLAVKELFHQNRKEELIQLFREPAFQFNAIRFDDVSQIGVIIGLHFRNYTNQVIEEALLREANFRNLVVKSNVDYTQFNAKYGIWINYMETLPDLDPETSQFLKSLRPFMFIMNKQIPPSKVLGEVPALDLNQHPILFGRIFCLKIIFSKSKKEKLFYLELMKARLQAEPQNRSELLYVPSIQSLLTKNKTLVDFTFQELQDLPFPDHWYQISLLAIEQIFVASRLLVKKDFQKARALISNNPIEQIRFGYKEIMDVYISFFKCYIASKSKEATTELAAEFKAKRAKVNLPLFETPYFENYFSQKL